jgi:primosomal protein N' (replication factor Y)
MTLYADVILPLPLDQPYTYSVSKEMEAKVQVGSRVLVPLGERWLTGIVVGLRQKKPRRAMKIKPVAEMLDETPLFTPPLLAFVRRLGQFFLVPWGEMLQYAVPPSFLIRTRTSVFLTPKGKEALEKGLLSEDESRLAAVLGTRPHTPLFLERKSGLRNVSALLSRMRKKDFVSVEKSVSQVRRRTRPEAAIEPAQLELDFSADETVRRATEMISGAMVSRTFSPFLLLGPAGRRKAVYSRLLQEAVSRGGRVLFLVPEISLTSALIMEFEKSLGDGLALLHSRLTERQREFEWRKVRERRAEIVIGPRSALFSPLEELRLIILDEEQDESYSQQEGLPFDVRRAARLRAEQEKAVLVMGSPAPTVESFHRARKGRFLIDLGPESFRPKVTILDFRGRSGLIDPRLIRAIQERLNGHEQTLLFFNRRGYASYLVCNRCGFTPICDRCDLPLAYHRGEGKLVCHACRRTFPVKMQCPQCRGHMTVRRNPGIEAMAEDLRRTFPGKRIEVFATDEAGRKEKKESLLEGFEKREIDILVGTQFLAHQTEIRPVPLVGILHPEMALHRADFRSGQKAFQAISRACRFLREEKGAEVFIQTIAPDHYGIREAARRDYLAFYKREIDFRRLLDYPPFSSLAEVVFSGVNVRRVAATARTFASHIRDSDADVQVFGPSLAPLARKRGLFRVQVSLKSRKPGPLKKTLLRSLQGIRSKKSVVLFP